MMPVLTPLKIRQTSLVVLHFNVLASRPPAGRDSPTRERKRRVSLRDIVVTPDRIPQFTIPSLGVSSSRAARKLSACSVTGGGAWRDIGSPRRHSLSGVPSEPGSQPHRRRPAPPSPLGPGGEPDLSADPVTRAAMSLPHLPKITTPYGFLALGESPCIHRNESLFFDDASLGLRRGSASPSPLPRRLSSPLAESRRRPPCRDTGARTGPGHPAPPPSACPVSAEPREQGAETGEKTRLQRLLKKRLADLRRLRPGSCFLKARRERLSPHPAGSGAPGGLRSQRTRKT
ncbi:C2 calcium-dependent domain-containing protein 4B-like [Lepisosteus oculatus]|uniref:C2 calcium-dependent domain-containing protein 4B-like n=1 Tax=Lepisosteus oculatus TaxID=7918 RepID=UPI00371E0631